MGLALLLLVLVFVVADFVDGVGLPLSFIMGLFTAAFFFLRPRIITFSSHDEVVSLLSTQAEKMIV